MRSDALARRLAAIALLAAADPQGAPQQDPSQQPSGTETRREERRERQQERREQREQGEQRGNTGNEADAERRALRRHERAHLDLAHARRCLGADPVELAGRGQNGRDALQAVARGDVDDEDRWERLPSGEVAVVLDLDETTKGISIDAAQDKQRARSEERFEFLRNVIAVKYGRQADGTLVSTLTLGDPASQAEYGDQGITLEAANTLGRSAIGDMQGTLVWFSSVLPMFSRPHKVIRRTVDLRYFERLHPGTHVDRKSVV